MVHFPSLGSPTFLASEEACIIRNGKEIKRENKEQKQEYNFNAVQFNILPSRTVENPLQPYLLFTINLVKGLYTKES